MAELVKIPVSNTEYQETIASLPGFGMAPEGHLSYSADLNMRARRGVRLILTNFQRHFSEY